MIRRVMKTHVNNPQMVKALAAALVAIVAVSALGQKLAVATHLNIGYLTLVHVLTDRPLPGLYDLDGSVPLTPSESSKGVQAQQHFTQAAHLEPAATSSAGFALAHTFGLLGRVDQAKNEWVARIRSSDARSSLNTLAFGLWSMRSSEYEQAEQIWATDGLNIANYFIQHGDSYLRTFSDPKIALQYYQLAERLRRDAPELAMRIVMASIMADQAELARQNLDDLLSTSTPDEFADEAMHLHSSVTNGFVWVLIAASDAFQERQDMQNAEVMLLKAQQVQPDPISYSRLGHFYCENGWFEKGVEILQKAKPFGKQHYALESRKLLSLCYCREGFREEAMREAEDLAHLAPIDSEFRNWPPELEQNWQSTCQSIRQEVRDQ